MNDQNERSTPKTLEGTSPQTVLPTPKHDWLRAAADPGLTEDEALSLLKRADLPREVIEHLAKNRSAVKLRKVKLALACHGYTPRHVSIPLIRQLYTFDLMKVALSPAVPPDIRLSADEALIARLKTMTMGERSTLARRASGRVAGALLFDVEERIMRAALENGRLTEAQVAQAVVSPEVGAALVRTVSRHEKWSHRRDVQAALLRTEHLPLSRALAFTRKMRVEQLTEVLQASRLPEMIKQQLLQSLNGNPG
jgi:hypothetical protein